MELDSRFWSIFMFVAISCLFVAAISTPYAIKGVTVSFGEVGLWNIDYNATTPTGGATGHFKVTQILMCVAAVNVACAFIGYMFLCRKVASTTQFATFLFQVLAGVFAICAIGVFASNDSNRSEGWWMATMAGVLYLVNGIVILIMPCLDSDHYKQPNRVVYIS